ncbi:GntR family transcriptional regulator [Salibacterium aidingense]|uniref:GntR family transcriptional regulator n=1 Tax=Salibacterium aidingense TaxID=384933 RepID=UPI00040FFC45|nr:GntR family transcriptional regulator [Salibacterium aidingense]
MEDQNKETGRIPLYRQIKQLIIHNIQTKHWKPGDFIPSESKLLDEFNVSRTTLRQAINSLVQEGVLESRQGKGTQVKIHPPGKLGEHSTIMFQEEGDQFYSRILRMEFSFTFFQAQKHLNVPENEKVFLFERVRMADGDPIAILQFYTPQHIGELLIKSDLHEHEPYAVIEENNGILKQATDWVSAVNATPHEADLLGIRGGESLVSISRLSYGIDEKPVEFSRTIYRADRFSYRVELAHN